jgi:hypothetical protein
MFCPGEKRASFAGLTSPGAGSGPVEAGLMVNAELRETLLSEPEMIAEVEVVTVRVVTEKLALVDPAPIRTLAGTVASALLLESATMSPPLGAGLVRWTVPCELFPPMTVVGLSESDDKLAGGGGGVSVSVVIRVTPL